MKYYITSYIRNPQTHIFSKTFIISCTFVLKFLCQGRQGKNTLCYCYEARFIQTRVMRGAVFLEFYWRMTWWCWVLVVVIDGKFLSMLCQISLKTLLKSDKLLSKLLNRTRVVSINREMGHEPYVYFSGWCPRGDYETQNGCQENQVFLHRTLVATELFNSGLISPSIVMKRRPLLNRIKYLDSVMVKNLK